MEKQFKPMHEGFNKIEDTNPLRIKDVELPFFFGFYNSPLEDDYEIDNEIDEEVDYYRNELHENVDYKDFDFNTKAYRNEIVNCFVEAIKSYLPDWITDIDSFDLDSPKEYNFSTDRIYVTATLTDNWKDKLADFFQTNSDWLTERIKTDWTSRSGFHSWIHNNVTQFYKELMEAEPRYLSIVIQYAIELNEGKDYNAMQWQMTDDTIEMFWQCNSVRDYIYKKEKNNEE